ncbi:glycosyltransferase family 2 protein [Haladaptatus caseinilyticus]|uniref:glycosyltransferase family 2 protein n=1 Tax=Haladaptatus caseinilyticus TaxID=2993314 RepID=UPI00224B679B|nr:glycosyltransferase family 2 protein [Haladaptatus caseinilyticus]
MSEEETIPSSRNRTVAEEQDADSPGNLLVGKDSAVTPLLSVIMPTLNEEDGIAECIEMVKRGISKIGVTTEIIISDSSTDRTPEIAREMGAIVVEPDKPGYGYAYRYAFDHARGRYIVIGDADTTYDFEDIPRLLEEVTHNDADMVMGSRLEGEIKSGAMPPLHQYIGNPLLTKFLNTFYGAGVSDAHSGFRIIEREAYEELELKTTGMEYASEMIMEAGARDMTIKEVPITYHEREGDATLDSFSDGWRHVKFMLVNAPGYLFSVPAMFLSGIGLLVMFLAYTGITINGVHVGLHSMIAGSLLAISGYQVGSLGVFATVAGNPIKQSRQPIMGRILKQLQLEHAATLGVLLFAGGTVYAAYLVIQWVSSGFVELPLLMDDILAFTAIVLGVQTIFSAFLVSTISE